MLIYFTEVKFAPPQDTPPGVYNATLWLVADEPYHHDVRIPIQVTVIGRYFLPGILKAH